MPAEENADWGTKVRFTETWENEGGKVEREVAKNNKTTTNTTDRTERWG